MNLEGKPVSLKERLKKIAKATRKAIGPKPIKTIGTIALTGLATGAIGKAYLDKANRQLMSDVSISSSPTGSSPSIEGEEKDAQVTKLETDGIPGSREEK